MNKKLIIALVGVIILVAGGTAAYQLINKDKDGKTVSNSQQETSNSVVDEIASVTGSSISKLLGSGISRKCTYSDDASHGTIYITSNSRMRADFTSNNPEDGNGSMIITDSKQYLWDTDTKEGFSMSYDPSSSDDELESDMTEDENDSVDLNQEYDFKCSVWIADESLLTPPADVSFADMSAWMPGHAH